MEVTNYISFFSNVKQKIRAAQVKATLSANAQMIQMYWDIGKMISEKQKIEGWGASVILKLSLDLKKEMPELRGFSERNLKNMLRFANEYSIGQQPVAFLENIDNQQFIIMQQPAAQLKNDVNSILQQPVAKLDNDVTSILQLSTAKIKNDENLIMQSPTAQLTKLQLLFSITWTHNIILIEKIKDIDTRFWYINQTIENGWSVDNLSSMIKSKLHERNRSLVHNFDAKLSNLQSELVKQTLKDPYIFDFLTLTEPFVERELEVELIKHIEKFLLELGTGFAFVGRQYHIEVGEKDFYIDLLFYHIKMRCFVVIDLKKGEFKPEYAGKMNFYCSVIDDVLKHTSDQPTIGLILCENKNKIIAEYALKDTLKAIGISEYEFTKSLPENLKSSLPSIEEIEKELSK